MRPEAAGSDSGFPDFHAEDADMPAHRGLDCLAG